MGALVKECELKYGASQTSSGKLKGKQILWSDGDVWTLIEVFF